MAKQETKEKKAPVKKKVVQKAQENLVLKKTIHIPGTQVYQDGTIHFVQGQHYKAGTVVTEEMLLAYEAVSLKLGGNTPITKFCN